eukprot:scaffold14803_cov67-Phaeocystis_antarctica.AAC.1
MLSAAMRCKRGKTRGAVGPGEGPEGLWGLHSWRPCVEERAAQRPRRQCGSATWLCAAEEAHGMLWKDVGRLGDGRADASENEWKSERQHESVTEGKPLRIRYEDETECVI